MKKKIYIQPAMKLQTVILNQIVNLSTPSLTEEEADPELEVEGKIRDVDDIDLW